MTDRLGRCDDQLRSGWPPSALSGSIPPVRGDRSLWGSELDELLAARIRSGQRNDDARIALVLEGGAMRGVISAGMATALEELKVTDWFDLIVGTSAGAINALAVLAGKIGPFARHYPNIISARELVNPRRALRGLPIIDGARMIASIDARFQLAEAATSRRPTRLAFIATDIDSATSHALTDFTGTDDVRRSLNASGLLPWVAGPPIEHRGRRWLDGGIIEPIPIESARMLGATHLSSPLALSGPAPASASPTSFSDAICAVSTRNSSATTGSGRCGISRCCRT